MCEPVSILLARKRRKGTDQIRIQEGTRGITNPLGTGTQTDRRHLMDRAHDRRDLPPEPPARRSTRSSPSPATRAGRPTSDRRTSTTAPAATPRRSCRWSRCRPGKTANSPRVKRDLPPARDTLQRRRCRGSRVASYASTGDRAFLSNDRRTDVRDRLPDRPTRLELRRQPARRRPRAATPLSGMTVAGAPVHLTGFDALQQSERRRRRAGRAARGADRRLRRADRAGLRVRLVPGDRAARDGDLLRS